MDYLPIFLDVRGRPCLVVGGGEVAARKAQWLASAGAQVLVVAPRPGPALSALLADGIVRHLAAEYSAVQLVGKALAIAATDDRSVNGRVAADARRRNLPVNVVDDPALCGFIVPAVVERGPVTIAIGSGGQSPVLARMLRARLETLIPAGYGLLADLAGRFRERVKGRFAALRERRLFWEQTLAGPVAELALAGRRAEAEAALSAAIEHGPQPDTRGEVYLIGAGPGDPELLTLRALRLLQQADVVVYDRLVSDAIVALARRDAGRIYVGKRCGDHSMKQEDISLLLARLATEGKKVARLKGGDPFVFGRGGEELEVLVRLGLPFQVVPGITAATGCAAYAGIPLTHRDHAQSVRFVTAHSRDDGPGPDWAALATARETLVFYMGLKGVDRLCHKLIEHGLPAATPAAVVEQGTTARQRVFTATVATLADTLCDQEVGSPSLIIVGDVVSLHRQLAWFQPLAGGPGLALQHPAPAKSVAAVA